MFISHLNNFISTMGTLLTSVYVYARSTNSVAALPAAKRAVFVIWCFISAFFYTIASHLIPPFMIRAVICASFIILIRLMAKARLETAVSAYLFSYGASYSLLTVSGALLALFFAPLMSAGSADYAIYDFNDLASLILVSLIASAQLLMAFLFFRIRRFTNGFPFLFEKYAVILALIVSGAILAIVSVLASPREVYGDNYALLSLVASVIIIGAGIIVLVRRGITMFYKMKMAQRSIELLEKALAEEKEENQRLTAKYNSARIAIHEFNHRLRALERLTVSRAAGSAENGFSADAGETAASDLELIRRLAQSFNDSVGQAGWEKPLPTTRVRMVDCLFEHFAAICMEKGIDFNLRLGGSIPYMVDKVIPQDSLETMLGDHINNAIIAVSSGSNSFRSILVVLGVADDCYELSVLDSGAQFDLDTLARLGTANVTTHADSGGSGLGFMSTFRTMRECGASLVISEKPPSATDFSKSVTIRFDGRNEYTVQTYRADELKALCGGQDGLDAPGLFPIVMEG